MRIRAAAAHELIDLRNAVLRPGLPRETATFFGDDSPTAKHFVAEQDGKVIGCATLHPIPWNNEPAWQLRGMAVDPAHQRVGVGAALLRAVDEAVLRSSTHQLWCNARISAVDFYQKQGWRIVSEVFEVPLTGPHVKMTKNVRA